MERKGRGRQRTGVRNRSPWVDRSQRHDGGAANAARRDLPAEHPGREAPDRGAAQVRNPQRRTGSSSGRHYLQPRKCPEGLHRRIRRPAGPEDHGEEEHRGAGPARRGQPQRRTAPGLRVGMGRDCESGAGEPALVQDAAVRPDSGIRVRRPRVDDRPLRDREQEAGQRAAPRLPRGPAAVAAFPDSLARPRLSGNGKSVARRRAPGIARDARSRRSVRQEGIGRPDGAGGRGGAHRRQQAGRPRSAQAVDRGGRGGCREIDRSARRARPGA